MVGRGGISGEGRIPEASFEARDQQKLNKSIEPQRTGQNWKIEGRRPRADQFFFGRKAVLGASFRASKTDRGLQKRPGK